jgi:hypothetical protein
MFDFDKGEFYLDATNKARVRSTTDGREILTQVVQKILHDTRYRYLAYPNSYGNEVESVIAEDYPREVLESELQRVYTEALIYHPLIQDVRDFSFEQEDEKLFCSFTVVGINEIILQMREDVSK